MKSPLARGLAAALLLLALACGGGLAPQPVPIDHANCARCGMLISDGRTAAEGVFANADPLFYDDVGCMASARIVSEGPFQLWVRVDGGAAWRKASEAFYARPADARTPMGYGIFAFSTPEKARSQDREGKARTWKEVQEFSRAAAGGPVAGKEGA